MTVRARARHLYLGKSFQDAARHVEKNCAAWVILSGKYGIVYPDNILDPYDFDLRKQSKSYIEEWAADVNHKLRMRFPGATFLIAASQPYLKALKGLQYEILFRRTG